MKKQASFEILATPPETLEAHASLFGDNVMWLKFIFTDDSPNANKQGIRQDEYDNIIRTGRLKPFKKMVGSIGEGHDDSVPIGTIASLEKVENRIEAIAAIWEREFPDDVEQIREAHATNSGLNVSWEVLYQDEILDENGVSWLQGVSTRAATLVNRPAYEGRTPILAVAAQWTTAFINNLPDSAFLYVEPGGTKDEDGKTTPRSKRHLPYKGSSGEVDLPHLRNAISRLGQSGTGKGWLSEDLRKRLMSKAQGILQRETGQKSKNEGDSSMELEQLKAQLEVKEEKLSAAEAELEELKVKLEEGEASLEELQDQLKELEELRQFKEQVEADRARTEQLDSRYNQIAEAGIEMSREEFANEAERWLGMDDEAFNFVLKMLVNTPPGRSEATASTPPMTGGENSDDEDPLSLIREFLEKQRKNSEESE